MLTLKQIIGNRDEVVRRLGKKHFAPAAEMIDQVIALDSERRAAQKELDAKLAAINQLSKSIGALMQQGKKAEADEYYRRALTCPMKLSERQHLETQLRGR